LTEFQQQKPQMQNVKAVPAASHSGKAASLAGSPLALADEHDSLSTFNESARKPAKKEETKEIPPPVKAPTPKGPPLELTLEPLVEARPDYAEASSPDDDYYPVLTDVVDESELSAPSKA